MSKMADPWAAFWDSGGAAAHTASLAELSPATRARLDAPWRELARELPRRGTVLDLATGGGIVLEVLRSVRPDLRLTGVDAAQGLPSRAGMTLKGGVRNERLPFPAARFDAVVSRFGIEYGDLDLSAGEAARVMRPGARLRLILHHSGGVVLAHNRARHKALRWAAVDSGWFAKAVNLTKARALPGLPQLGGVEAAPAEAMARFPEQPVAGEFLTGLYQVLQVGSARPAEQVLAALDSLRGRAVDEIGRLEALAGAACDHARIERLRAAFDRAEVDAAPAQVISNASGGILAWTIGGTRR